MKGLVVPVLCLALLSACSRKAPEPQAAAGSAESAAPAAAAEPARPAPSGEAAKVEITDALVAKYVEYEKQSLRLISDFAAETRKNLEGVRGDAAKTLGQIAANDKLAKDLDAKQLAARRALGLSEEQYAVIKEAAMDAGTARLLYDQMGGDAQLAKMEAEQKEQIASLPADQREAAAAESTKMIQSIRDMRDLTELRKKYGNAAADALLKYADVLAAQRSEAMKALAGQR